MISQLSHYHSKDIQRVLQTFKGSGSMAKVAVFFTLCPPYPTLAFYPSVDIGGIGSNHL
jgi:hypothetical protein